MLSVLVIDDDRTTRETLAEFFEALGYVARTAGTATEGRQQAAAHSPDVALVDVRLPDADGLRLFEALRADDPELSVIFLTGHADVPTAVRAMREGAADFLEKPVQLEALDAAVRRAVELGRLRREVHLLRARDADALWADTAPRDARGGDAIVPSLDRLVALAARNDDAPVLVAGETGTGKGYVARQIHERSPRAQAPFVEINCASLQASFFESELFGHEKGAFTDAKQAKRGLLEVAARGTVFLDEIAEMSGDVQPKLLKAIEERTFRRLGGTATLRSDARVIVATHQPLAEAVAQGRFRADLYYRLQVLTITLPPLRARRDEIPVLAHALLPRGARLADRAVAALVGYAWPGNIRELKNALWRASILAEGGPIGPEHLGLGDAPAVGAADTSTPGSPVTLAEAERRAIGAALGATGGNKARAAELLGIARSTLNEKLRRTGAAV
ncbi:MAG TPA: sigma-54 dependent transcriptional regulator [Gemmatirosa sp.]|nr:sigma-54 dependent transcriptional regulator [Gemmatirosa sp.]